MAIIWLLNPDIDVPVVQHGQAGYFTVHVIEQESFTPADNNCLLRAAGAMPVRLPVLLVLVQTQVDAAVQVHSIRLLADTVDCPLPPLPVLRDSVFGLLSWRMKPLLPAAAQVTTVPIQTHSAWHMQLQLHAIATCTSMRYGVPPFRYSVLGELSCSLLPASA